MPQTVVIKYPRIRKTFQFSIKNKKNCLFSRREGKVGKIILGYSVIIRLFNKDIV